MANDKGDVLISRPNESYAKGNVVSTPAVVNPDEEHCSEHEPGILNRTHSRHEPMGPKSLCFPLINVVCVCVCVCVCVRVHACVCVCRSMYSEGSNVDMDWGMVGLPSLAGLQPDPDVFLEGVCCQEAQCPLHKGSGEVRGHSSGGRP